MKNYEEIKSCLLASGYEESKVGLFIQEGKGTTKWVRITYKYITNFQAGTGTMEEPEPVLKVSSTLPAFAIVHMLIYTGAIDADRVLGSIKPQEVSHA